MNRCQWNYKGEKVYYDYHDTEWGIPVYDDHKLFEMLLLESFQAGLSWLTILKKREAFRKAFADFDVYQVANFDTDKYHELINNADIIRNKLKIKAAINNAKIFIEIQKEYKTFANYIWSFTDYHSLSGPQYSQMVSNQLSDQVSNDLKKRGMKFVGTVIIYSYLAAIGVINAHDVNCDKYNSK